MIEQEDMIAAIKELHLENDQLRDRLGDVMLRLGELNNDYVALTKRVDQLEDK